MAIARARARATADDKRLIQAVREMGAHREGRLALSSRNIVPSEVVDVASIRKSLGYNQKQFAGHYGFALSAVRDWEQGRRTPERSARILLTLIDRNPQAIEQALAHLPA